MFSRENPAATVLESTRLQDEDMVTSPGEIAKAEGPGEESLPLEGMAGAFKTARMPHVEAGDRR